MRGKECSLNPSHNGPDSREAKIFRKTVGRIVSLMKMYPLFKSESIFSHAQLRIKVIILKYWLNYPSKIKIKMLELWLCGKIKGVFKEKI